MTFVGNTLSAGRDDGGKGAWSPDHALVVKDCAQTVIASNVMHRGAIKSLIHDLGGHGEGFIQRDNVGGLWQGRRTSR